MGKLLIFLLISSLIFVLNVECRVIGDDSSSNHDLSSNSEEDNRTEAQKVFDSIPEYERPHFVTYHIAKAAEKDNRTDIYFIPKKAQFPEKLSEKFQEIPVPTNFSRNLLNWTEKHFIHRCLHMRRNPSLSDICFLYGCVDPGDIGNICCPF